MFICLRFDMMLPRGIGACFDGLDFFFSGFLFRSEALSEQCREMCLEWELRKNLPCTSNVCCATTVKEIVFALRCT